MPQDNSVCQGNKDRDVCKSKPPHKIAGSGLRGPQNGQGRNPDSEIISVFLCETGCSNGLGMIRDGRLWSGQANEAATIDGTAIRAQRKPADSLEPTPVKPCL